MHPLVRGYIESQGHWAHLTKLIQIIVAENQVLFTPSFITRLSTSTFRIRVYKYISIRDPLFVTYAKIVEKLNF